MTKVQAPARPSPSREPATPEADVHVVKRGDTLSEIARDHGVSLQKLVAANPQIENPNLIFPGQHVRIPRKVRPSEPEARPEKAPVAPKTQRGARQQAARNAQAPRGRVEAEAPPTPTTTAKPPATAKDAAPTGAIRSTRGMTEAQKFDYYRGVIEAHGGKFHAAPDARNVVGLRSETDPRSNGGAGALDDKFVMLWQDRNGHKHVREYRGTTEGIEDNRRRYSSDVNGDGSADLGRVPTGYYEYTPGHSDRLGNVLRPTRAFQVERDYNHDGKFEGREKHADRSASFLFHQGSSAGCQTMPAGTWGRFWADIHSSGHPSRIGYTLIKT